MADWMSAVTGAISKGRGAVAKGLEKVFGPSSGGGKSSTPSVGNPPSIIPGHTSWGPSAGVNGTTSPRGIGKWGRGV
jgi:hypothetical protein